MKMRLLTSRFTSYNIAQMEKKHKKEFISFIDVGNLSVEKMLTLIMMGNSGCNEEKAAEKLDNFLNDEDNSLLDAYIQLIDELDRDTKLLRKSGLKIEDLRKQFERGIADNIGTTSTEETELETVENNTVLREDETPKVDINGYVSLD